MPARCSVTYGIPGEGRDVFVNDFVRAAAEDPFTTWLILPTERLVKVVARDLAEKNITFISSRICTLKDFCLNYFEDNRRTTRFLSKAESKIILAQILDEKKDQVPLFFTRSRPSSGTIDDLSQFINVITTRKVSFPGCLGELQSEKSRQIDLIVSSYRKKLDDLDYVDGDTLLEWTILHLTLTGADRLGTVFVYGLYKPLPLEQDLLLSMREHSRAFYCSIPSGSDPHIFSRDEIWSSHPTTTVSIEPSSPFRSQLTGLFSDSGTIDTSGNLRIDTFTTHYAELQGIAAEICRLHDSGVPFTDIYVAFPELQSEIRLIEEIFLDFGIPWNSAVGSRISQYPVIQFLTGIIGLVVNQYSREDVVKFVNSPYFGSGNRNSIGLDPAEVDLVSRYAQIESGRGEWEERLDRLHSRLSDESGKKGILGINPQSVEKVREEISALFKDLATLEGERPLQDFISRYEHFLDKWKLPFFEKIPAENIRLQEEYAHDKFREILGEISKISRLLRNPKVNAGDFLRVISTMTDESKLSGLNQQQGVSVLGIRECAHQHFPYLFIAGMTDGAFPSLTTRLPFTNTLENAKMGTRSLGDILREGQYYFISALLAGREHVYLSAPLSDGETPLLTSAFFERVREKTDAGPWRIPDESIALHSRRDNAVRTGLSIGSGEVCASLENLSEKFVVDDLVERINMERYHRRGTCDSPYDGVLSGDEQICMALSERYGPLHIYSPTALETYAECPFRFFLKKVAGLEPLPEVEPNLSAGDRGTVIHDILCNFYREWRRGGRSKILPSVMTDATELMREIASKELERHSFRSPLWEATCIQMLGGTQTGPGYFECFLQRESEEEGSPLVPMHFEFSFGMGKAGSDDPASISEPVELAAPNGSEKILVMGRIDRVDVTPDGFFLIYDYKTGAQHPRIKDIETGKALQLSLYILAFENVSGKEGVAAGYYKIRREVENKILLCDETGRCMIASRPKVSKDFQNLINRSVNFAIDYIHRIRKGEFPLPHEEKCPNEYCEFRTICRFDPYRVFCSTEVI